jgi:hypothetical protein
MNQFECTSGRDRAVLRRAEHLVQFFFLVGSSAVKGDRFGVAREVSWVLEVCVRRVQRIRIIALSAQSAHCTCSQARIVN